MSIRNNPYIEESFYRHLIEKTAKSYCSKGVRPALAKARARRDVEKLANVPVMKNFLSGFSKLLKGTSDDLVKSVNTGGTKIVATSADEAAAATAKATKGTPGAAAKDVANQTQALPKYQVAEGQTLGFGDKMKMHGANLLNTAAANPGTSLAVAGGSLGATGLATGAMLS